jgi:hypothetical protein
MTRDYRLQTVAAYRLQITDYRLDFGDCRYEIRLRMAD